MKRRSRSLERRNSRYGRLFVLPWEIGLALFFLYPLTQSVLWSFSDVAWKDGELQVIFAGLKHYRNILFVDGNYTYFLTDEIRSFCLSLPLIVILSLIFALILNMKLPGRMIARGIFFLPVIIASDVVIKMLFANGNAGPDSATVYTSDLIDLDLVLRDLGMPEKIVSLFSGVIGNIFDLIWKCGIQTVLFIAGLQTIPDALYEVSRVEGANRWEEFWFITFPMLSSTVVLVTVYTMIALVTDKNSIMMTTPFTLMTGHQIYDESSARLWLYFAIVGALMAAVMFFYDRLLTKRWE